MFATSIYGEHTSWYINPKCRGGPYKNKIYENIRHYCCLSPTDVSVSGDDDQDKNSPTITCVT